MQTAQSEKLQRVYDFLEHHQQWNAQFREREFRQYFSHCDTRRARLGTLLFNIVNTQQQPKLESLGTFWAAFERFHWNDDDLRLDDLTRFFRSCPTYKPGNRHNEKKEPIEKSGPWDDLFWAVRKNEGWGCKTAALLVKCIIFLHRAPPTGFHFLRDFDSHSIEHDTLYLPVDTVIEHVFYMHLGFPKTAAGFWKINNHLAAAGYEAEHMLVWDDLWYWGYLTQRTSGKIRKTEWNAPKFWSMQSFPKAMLEEVRALSIEFIDVLGKE